ASTRRFLAAMRPRRFALSVLVSFAVSRGLLGAGAEPADILIHGGTVVTMDGDRRVIENGAVAIRGDRIVFVGTAKEVARAYRTARTIDATGRVVMPGLINTHTHAAMVLFRGLADDLPLQEWLQKTIFPAEARNVTEDFVRLGTRLACLEMIQAGTTTFVDMYYLESATAAETARAGRRAVLGQGVLDFSPPHHQTRAPAKAATEGPPPKRE